jgi:hypothetical protein
VSLLSVVWPPEANRSREDATCGDEPIQIQFETFGKTHVNQTKMLHRLGSSALPF